MPEWRKQTDVERRNLAGRLRQARESAGLNQRQVAERLGIGSHSILSELENGQRRLDVVELIALAALYGKAPGWFLGDAADDAPSQGSPAHITGHLTIDGDITLTPGLDLSSAEAVAQVGAVIADAVTKPLVEITAQVDAKAEVGLHSQREPATPPENS